MTVASGMSSFSTATDIKRESSSSARRPPCHRYLRENQKSSDVSRGAELLGDPGGPESLLRRAGTRAALFRGHRGQWRRDTAGRTRAPAGPAAAPPATSGRRVPPATTWVLTQPAEEAQPRGRAPPPQQLPRPLAPHPSPRPRQESESPGRSAPRAPGSLRETPEGRARGAHAPIPGCRGHEQLGQDAGHTQSDPKQDRACLGLTGDPLQEGDAVV